MCSIPGLPAPGSNVSVLISRLNLNPLCVLVELWGSFDQERKATYERLQKEIQFPREAFRELDGNPGDLCLVKVYETWYRARIVSKTPHSYNVFLIDGGRTLSATTSMLAWGQNEFFHLPPELEFCVLSNVLPLSPENKWSPMALKFLKSLCGKVVMACVQDVLVPHRTFLLDIPCISRQMYEMGFAKKLTTERFKQYVIRALNSDSVAAAMPTDPQQVPSMRNNPLEVDLQLAKQQHYMYPELQTETVETVIVTEVTNPLRIFCQLKVFSQELKKLTEQITQHYEGRLAKGLVRPETLGSPCASRGSDGKWYRSILQQVFPANEAVEVLQVDYGKKQFVQLENIQALAPKFFWMPVVTYVCSLHGINDKGVGWTSAQIDYLRSLLLFKTVIGKFEYQSVSEGVHYVTLYGDGNVNINQLFGAKERCLLVCDKSGGDYADPRDAFSPPGKVGVEKRRSPLSPAVEERKPPISLPAEDLPVNSRHTAVVQHVTDPWEFWIQTDKYAVEFDQLMDDITELYDRPDRPDVVRAPSAGLYCAAKAQDEAYYRAAVVNVSSTKAKVVFVDYGNSETIDRSDMRVLPEKLQALPTFALPCRLAGVRPNGHGWDQPSTDFFTQTVADKILDVLVTEKSEGVYVVSLTDSKAVGVKDVGTLMCDACLAERDEGQTPRGKTLSRSFVTSTPLNAGAMPFGAYKENVALQKSPSAEPAARENRTAFKECLFTIGSALEVSVSFIESPSDFWCQLAHNLPHLRVLMQEMQYFYADSHFQTPLEAACVARHPDTGMWYRALVIKRHGSGAHVVVLFIDYGQTVTVPFQELRRMNPTFLQLRGQAFRCRLHNPTDPASSLTEWSGRAAAQFRDFVEAAAADRVGLKCTVHAVMYNDQKVLFNVVDLATPFESVCTRMLQSGVAHTPPPPPRRASAFRLDTYYYSTHSIKTGTEEQVSVTSVQGVDHFYCQLDRNADAVEELSAKVNDLCLQLENSSVPRTFGTVCFAKYTDGQWYRGQIKSTKPSVRVHFVDYGDTLEVDKSNLLPIPVEAGEIMTVPVQAVECGLADIPGKVPGEVNSWFESAMTDRSLRALVVAKEPGGKLMVELYDGVTQVNAQIREKFHVELREQRQSWRSREPGAADTRHSQGPSAPSWKADTETQEANRWFGSKPLPPEEEEANHSATPNSPTAVAENTRRTRPPTAVLYRTPHRRSHPADTENDDGQLEVTIKPQRLTPQCITPESPVKENEQNVHVPPRAEAEALPKLTALPSKCITPGMEADVFVSHCDGPLSFFVQLVSEEDGVLFISEKLNEGQAGEPVAVERLRPGDVACAEFPEDSSFYRAVVKEVHRHGTCLVEFIDFGNTATVSCSKLCRLPPNILQLPRYGTQCLLRGFAPVKGEALDPELVSRFKEEIGLNGEGAWQCRFEKQVGTVWEVSLEVDGKTITCEAPGRSVLSDSDVPPEKLPVSSTPAAVPPQSSPPASTGHLRYRRDNMAGGDTLEAYASTFTGTPSFWCQLADTEQLDKVTGRVAEVGAAAAADKAVDGGTLSPGSPCIALFTDDGQWYRAEVTSRDRDALVVLYVDYGNTSRVDVKDVRAMPAELMEPPPQAFLCRLEGFDASSGFWADGAAEHLSALITDKLLILTVFRMSEEEEEGNRAVCYVSADCEGEVVNKKMKEYWKELADKDQPETTADPPPCETPALPCALTTAEEEPELDFDKQASAENNIFQEIDAAVAFIQSQEEFTGEDTDRDPELQEEFVHAQTPSGDCRVEDDSEPACPLQNTRHVSYSREDTGNTVAVADIPGQNENGKDTEEDDQPVRETEVAEPAAGEPEPMAVSLCVKLTNEVKEARSVPTIVVSEAEPIETDVHEPVPDGGNATEGQSSPSEVDPSSDDIYDEAFEHASGVEGQESETKEYHPRGGDDETVMPTGDLDVVLEEQEAEEEEHHPTIIPESEFGRLRSAADKLPVGSPCVVYSPAVSTWCKAKVLKNFEDSMFDSMMMVSSRLQVLLVDHDTEMVVDPVSMFEVELSEPEQYDDDDDDDDDCSTEFDTASSQGDSQDDHDEDTTSDSEDTVTGDGPIKMEELVKDECPVSGVSEALQQSLFVPTLGGAEIADLTTRDGSPSCATQDETRKPRLVRQTVRKQSYVTLLR
ncbi:tudor domain-containing 6 [Aplochiton taeniatus]